MTFKIGQTQRRTLPEWAGLGKQVHWRSDGAVVYPFTMGTFFARHPTGGVVGKFPTAADAMHTVNARFPLERPPEAAPSARVLRLLNELGPADLLSLVNILPDVAKTILGPWTQTKAFGGAMIREVPQPRAMFAIVAETNKIIDLPGGVAVSRAQGPWMYRVWSERQRMWVHGQAASHLGAMWAADHLFDGEDIKLVPGLPTTTRWRKGGEGRYVRRLWQPGIAQDGRELCAVWRVHNDDGTHTGRWKMAVFGHAKRDGRDSTMVTVPKFREAKDRAERLLTQEGWVLRER